MARPKKETADFFPHHSMMRDDPKIKAVRRTYGITGYGVWCMLLEYFCNSRVFRVENTDLAMELLAGDFGIDIEELRGLLGYFVRVELIQQDEAGFSCQNLTEKYLKPLFDKREYDNERKSSSKKRGAQSDENALHTASNKARTNNTIFHSGKPLGKESTGKESKGKKRENSLSRSRSKESAERKHASIEESETADPFDYTTTKVAVLEANVPEVYFEELWHHYKGMGWKDGKNSPIQDIASKIIARWMKTKKEEERVNTLVGTPLHSAASARLYPYEWALEENNKQKGAMKLMQGYLVNGKVMYRYAPPDGSRLTEYVMTYPVDERKHRDNAPLAST